jgi:hypothetical protein
VIDDDIKIEIDERRARRHHALGRRGRPARQQDRERVRLTHMPTGIAVVSQGDRSQHKNRAEAWNMLRAKLYERELKKREEQAAADQAAKTDIGWGHQIRSYVLQPYQMVKDLRTGVWSRSCLACAFLSASTLALCSAASMALISFGQLLANAGEVNATTAAASTMRFMDCPPD